MTPKRASRDLQAIELASKEGSKAHESKRTVAEMKREVPTICVNFMVVVLISYLVGQLKEHYILDSHTKDGRDLRIRCFPFLSCRWRCLLDRASSSFSFLVGARRQRMRVHVQAFRTVQECH